MFAHPFVAHARAPLAQNATLGIVGYNRRQIPFGVIILFFSETFFEATPVECHLLQFALTAPVAYRTIQRVVREQEFRHTALGFFYFFTLRRDDHAIRAGNGAGRLQLRHLFNADEAHAAGRLQGQVGVVAK